MRRGDDLVSLTATEFELLRFLMRNPKRVMSKAQILDRVWNYDFGGQANIVELYISYLRKKIDAGREPMIHTMRGFGYVLKPGQLVFAARSVANAAGRHDARAAGRGRVDRDRARHGAGGATVADLPVGHRAVLRSATGPGGAGHRSTLGRPRRRAALRSRRTSSRSLRSRTARSSTPACAPGGRRRPALPQRRPTSAARCRLRQPPDDARPADARPVPHRLPSTVFDGAVQVTGLPEAQLQQTVTNLVTTELVGPRRSP